MIKLFTTLLVGVFVILPFCGDASALTKAEKILILREAEQQRAQQVRSSYQEPHVPAQPVKPLKSVPTEADRGQENIALPTTPQPNKKHQVASAPVMAQQNSDVKLTKKVAGDSSSEAGTSDSSLLTTYRVYSCQYNNGESLLNVILRELDDNKVIAVLDVNYNHKSKRSKQDALIMSGSYNPTTREFVLAHETNSEVWLSGERRLNSLGSSFVGVLSEDGRELKGKWGFTDYHGYLNDRPILYSTSFDKIQNSKAVLSIAARESLPENWLQWPSVELSAKCTGLPFAATEIVHWLIPTSYETHEDVTTIKGVSRSYSDRPFRDEISYNWIGVYENSTFSIHSATPGHYIPEIIAGMEPLLIGTVNDGKFVGKITNLPEGAECVEITVQKKGVVLEKELKRLSQVGDDYYKKNAQIYKEKAQSYKKVVARQNDRLLFAKKLSIAAQTPRAEVRKIITKLGGKLKKSGKRSLGFGTTWDSFDSSRFLPHAPEIMTFYIEIKGEQYLHILSANAFSRNAFDPLAQVLKGGPQKSISATQDLNELIGMILQAYGEPERQGQSVQQKSGYQNRTKSFSWLRDGGKTALDVFKTTSIIENDTVMIQYKNIEVDKQLRADIERMKKNKAKVQAEMRKQKREKSSQLF